MPLAFNVFGVLSSSLTNVKLHQLKTEDASLILLDLPFEIFTLENCLSINSLNKYITTHYDFIL